MMMFSGTAFGVIRRRIEESLDLVCAANLHTNKKRKCDSPGVTEADSPEVAKADSPGVTADPPGVTGEPAAEPGVTGAGLNEEPAAEPAVTRSELDEEPATEPVVTATYETQNIEVTDETQENSWW